jgi:hypothetical protein
MRLTLYIALQSWVSLFIVLLNRAAASLHIIFQLELMLAIFWLRVTVLMTTCFVLNHGVDFAVFKIKNMFVEF